MYQRGIRGAITVDDNSYDCLRAAVVELIAEIERKNEFSAQDISHVIFTLTKDINCVYPAKIAREEFADWKFVPMMCVQEMEIEQSLTMCLRVLIVINTELKQEEIVPVYLKGAKILRKDLNNA